MIRSMLKAKKCQRYFGGVAALTTIYILNKCPAKKIIKKTPYDAWTDLKKNVSHLRDFGLSVLDMYLNN